MTWRDKFRIGLSNTCVIATDLGVEVIHSVLWRIDRGTGAAYNEVSRSSGSVGNRTLTPECGLETPEIMLTEEGCRSRRARLWQSLSEKPDCIVVTSPRHLVYFAGFVTSPFVFRSQNACAALILLPDGSANLVADNIQRAAAEAAFADRLTLPGWYDGCRSAEERGHVVATAAAHELGLLAPDTLGMESGTLGGILNEGMVPFCTFADVSAALQMLQRRKDVDEIAEMRVSIEAGEAGHRAATEGIRPGMTELQAYNLVANASIDAVGEPVVVYGDFASGPNAIRGGGGPTNRVIEDGDLFILDFSVVVRGYRGDFTNTFVVGSAKADPRLKAMERACLSAMASAEELLSPGALCRNVDAACRNKLLEHNPEFALRHHVGHGIGLGHPDPPYIVPESSEALEVGDIVTLEPGQYHEAVGGMRFEHNYLITETGYERLTNHFVGLELQA